MPSTQRGQAARCWLAARGAEVFLAPTPRLQDDVNSLNLEYSIMRTIELARHALLASTLTVFAACSDSGTETGTGTGTETGSASAPAAAPETSSATDDASGAADMAASAIGETLQSVADEATELAAAGMEGVSMDGEGMQEAAAEMIDEAEEKAKALTEGADAQIDAAQQAVEDMIPNG